MHGLAGLVAVAPVVGCADAVLADEEVFGIVDVFVGAGLDAVDDLEASMSAFIHVIRPHCHCRSSSHSSSFASVVLTL